MRQALNLDYLPDLSLGCKGDMEGWVPMRGMRVFVTEGVDFDREIAVQIQSEWLGIQCMLLSSLINETERT